MEGEGLIGSAIGGAMNDGVGSLPRWRDFANRRIGGEFEFDVSLPRLRNTREAMSKARMEISTARASVRTAGFGLATVKSPTAEFLSRPRSI